MKKIDMGFIIGLIFAVFIFFKDPSQILVFFKDFLIIFSFGILIHLLIRKMNSYFEKLDNIICSNDFFKLDNILSFFLKICKIKN
ncbi:hypothetical protein [Cetobacterium sp.]|uniref:hypothetical protein n=1 Tax=Cetobacterium sp. TaxID=2071632 RepID=UPI003F2CFD91